VESGIPSPVVEIGGNTMVRNIGVFRDRSSGPSVTCWTRSPDQILGRHHHQSGAEWQRIYGDM
jgi:hypothetical protein